MFFDGNIILDLTNPFNLLLQAFAILVDLLSSIKLRAFGAEVSLFGLAVAGMCVAFLLAHFLPYDGGDE